MRVLDLFSGIGGFSLGLERAGMTTVAFCENEPYCRKVLAKHWPNVPCYGDIRELTAERLRADGISVDLICGGFPCQDISMAGKGAGLKGARSGLWSEFARLIGEIRPLYAIVENVSALLSRGLGTVLGDLAALGYDAEWHCIPASYVGAPHRRDRIWIMAYPVCNSSPGSGGSALIQREILEETGRKEAPYRFGIGGEGEDVNDPKCWQQSLGWQTGRMGGQFKSFSRNRTWPLTAEPVLGRRVDGIPNRMDRLRGLGNAVVPQIPEIIGKAIMAQ